MLEYSSLTWAKDRPGKKCELDACLPPWLADVTTILGPHQAGEARERTGDSLAITAPGDRLKMRPDNMMLGLTR